MMAPWWMLDALCVVLVLLHTLSALALAGHALAWVHLLGLRGRRPAPVRAASPANPSLRLLVQLPLFNEAAVVDGLLDAVAVLEWPRDRLSVQVLDDSTDDTPARVAARLPALRAAGLDIVHLRRADRAGFKAGALAAGLTQSDAELVAILDADFRPRPDWLRAAVGRLDPDVGLVQCRWSFSNADHSLLTRVQALHLDAHFAVEQVGRSDGRLMFGFNGTAGVWRRAAIDAAGGWEGDTLTEDLDLAYRAQLAGQRLIYADDLDVPCELPERLDAVRAQQHRWIRGGAQVAAKLLRRLWRDEPQLRRRVQGTLHLLASSLFLPVLVLCLVTPALALLRSVGPGWLDAALTRAGLLLRGVPVVLVAGYFVACRARTTGVAAAAGRVARDLVPFLALVTALCAHNSRAALLGWRGPTGTFVRTPKGGTRAVRQALPETLAAEVGLALWCGVGAGVGLATGQVGLAGFLVLQAVGFTVLAAWTVLERRPQRAAQSPAAVGR